jgi:hypothetical protein
LDAGSTFSENVTVSGSGGKLKLAQSQGYTGSITGFSKTVKSTQATLSGTTKSGVLTVTDGTHTAHITLIGDYTQSTFVASSDGHGGTIIVDPQGQARCWIRPVPRHTC